MRTVEELYREMMEVFARETGTAASDGSDLTVRLYAVASQLYGLYVQADYVGRQAFPQTAQGEYLDQHAALRGVARRGAAPAQGVLRFGVDRAGDTPRNIPAGTVCMTAGAVRFETTADGVLEAGESYVDVPAQAVEAGTTGNVAAGTVRSMAVPPVGVGWVNNPSAFAGGSETEGDESLRLRVLETFRRLPNGANAAFYHQCAMAFPQVAACAVLPRNRGIGTVDVVIATQEGMPDGALLQEVGEQLQQRREIAVDVAVKAPTSRTVNVSVTVTPAEGAEGAQVGAAVEAAVRQWFSGERLGKDVLRAELGAVAFAVEGVANYALTSPAADVAVAAHELPTLETLTVEVKA